MAEKVDLTPALKQVDELLKSTVERLLNDFTNAGQAAKAFATLYERYGQEESDERHRRTQRVWDSWAGKY